ncbi:MAG: hypothetical protein B6I17_04185 [Tenericutes bacterium 4572_104]|nr:MAG: hypothetical protein B6I17_04185 [Tenericutes bacterium 4572_104]
MKKHPNTEFDPYIFNLIISLVRDGHTIISALKQPISEYTTKCSKTGAMITVKEAFMPSKEAFFKRLQRYPECEKDYREAIQARNEIWKEEIADVSKDRSRDVFTNNKGATFPDNVSYQRDKLIADNLDRVMWLHSNHKYHKDKSIDADIDMAGWGGTFRDKIEWIDTRVSDKRLSLKQAQFMYQLVKIQTSTVEDAELEDKVTDFEERYDRK